MRDKSKQDKNLAADENRIRNEVTKNSIGRNDRRGAMISSLPILLSRPLF